MFTRLSFWKSTILRDLPSFLGTTNIHEHRSVGSPAGTASMIPILLSPLVVKVVWDCGWDMDCLWAGIRVQVDVVGWTVQLREWCMSHSKYHVPKVFPKKYFSRQSTFSFNSLQDSAHGGVGTFGCLEVLQNRAWAALDARLGMPWEKGRDAAPRL